MANRINPAIKVVALDFDGVITNLDVDWNAAIRGGSKIVGHDIKSLILFYENNYDTPIFQKVSAEMEKIELAGIAEAQAAPFLEEFLKELCERKIKIYVVSMQNSTVIKTFFDQHGLTSYFSGIITREKCPSKPAQVQCITKETDIDLSQILLVDDSKRNINNCQALGIKCFYFKSKQSHKNTQNEWKKILNLINS